MNIKTFWYSSPYSLPAMKVGRRVFDSSHQIYLWRQSWAMELIAAVVTKFYWTRRQSLITSEIHRPKFRWQSIPTNCANSVLNSWPFIKCVFFKLSTLFCFYKQPVYEQLTPLGIELTFRFESSSLSNDMIFEILQKYFQNVLLFSINPIKNLNVYAE